MYCSFWFLYFLFNIYLCTSFDFVPIILAFQEHSHPFPTTVSCFGHFVPSVVLCICVLSRNLSAGAPTFLKWTLQWDANMGIPDHVTLSLWNSVIGKEKEKRKKNNKCWTWMVKGGLLTTWKLHLVHNYHESDFLNHTVDVPGHNLQFSMAQV